jgi:hypothetical protein
MNFGKWKMESVWKDTSEEFESDEIDGLREKRNVVLGSEHVCILFTSQDFRFFRNFLSILS